MAVITDLFMAYPRGSIIVLGVVISFFISLIQHFVLDKEKVRNMKKRQKELQEESKAHRDNPEKMKEINKEFAEHSLQMLKHTFRPMLIYAIPLLVLFAWLRGIYIDTELAARAFIFPKWVWYYVLGTVASSLVFRKLFKLP